MSTELVKTSDFLPVSQEAIDVWTSEMEGEAPEFRVISTPTAGGTTWEVEGEDPSKELVGVVVDNYVTHVWYEGEYTGEGRPPGAFWVNDELQYLTEDARRAGIHEQSHKDFDSGVQNRQVLYLARPGLIVPDKIDLTGASCKPWKRFKSTQITNLGKRVTSVVVGLSLESVKYKSGYSGSVLVPRIMAPLPDESAAAYYEMAEQLKPYTRLKRTPTAQSESPDLAGEFAAAGIGDAPELV